MKATKLVEKVRNLILEHGDFEVFERETGATVSDIIFSDVKSEPWFEMILKHEQEN